METCYQHKGLSYIKHAQVIFQLKYLHVVEKIITYSMIEDDSCHDIVQNVTMT